MKTIDGEVMRSAEMAYDRSTLDITNLKQKKWAEAIDAYFNSGTVTFINAKYGYAVEELTNIRLKSAGYSSISGYTVNLQVRHGSTIPDIVLTDSRNIEIAWLDITSENSVDHINNKVGTGWNHIQFVAELLYPDLDLTQIRTARDGSIGARARARSICRQHVIFQKNVDEYFKDQFTVAMKNLEEMLLIDQPFIAAKIESAFNLRFPETYKHPTIKSMLQMFIENYPESDASTFCQSLLSNYYSGSKQSKSSADAYILKSYENYVNKQKIFA